MSDTEADPDASQKVAAAVADDDARPLTVAEGRQLVTCMLAMFDVATAHADLEEELIKGAVLKESAKLEIFNKWKSYIDTLYGFLGSVKQFNTSLSEGSVNEPK